MSAHFDAKSGSELIENSDSESGIAGESIKENFTASGENHVLRLKYSATEFSTADELVGVGPKESMNNSNIMSSQKLPGKPNRKNLRVTFPEGNEVSGYMDPPIPWDDVSSCTTEVLVSSYLKACEKFGVKPIQRLLNQLQAVVNFQERNETLTLRNDHLDYRHCETLEEVLRRVQFRTIDLEATKLDDEAAVVIFDMLEYYESCMKLNISFNRSFGTRGWQACARLVKKASCLQQLDAQGCNLADHLMPFMARALKIGTSLLSLHLENTTMSGKSLATLVMILKTNETLRELHLSDNKITSSDAAQLGSLIKFNKAIKLLDLRNNQLQDVGMGHLCEGILGQGSSGGGLETLVLWNNQLTYQSMNSLCRALMETRSLVDINLGKNNITNEGVHRIKEGFLKNRSLLRIRLQAAKISCEGAVAIAEYLAETTKLLRVDLRDNDIKTGGLMALSLAMKVNKSVIRVDLDKEPKKENGIKDYVTQQKNLLVDIFSYVDRNNKLVLHMEESRRALEIDQKKLDSTVEHGIPNLTEVSSPMSQESKPCQDEEWTLAQAKEETIADKKAPLSEISNPSCTNDEINLNPANSNNSSRSKLHLELESISSKDVSLEDLLTESTSPPSSNKLLFNVPLSPMVVLQGTASLIPVKSNGIFSPEDSSVVSARSEENIPEPAKIEGTPGDFECLHPSPSDQDVAVVQKDGKVSKKGGKMPREKRKKFIVTKTPGHHYYHHNYKKIAIKHPRRLSNVTLDAISAIDKTANAITVQPMENSSLQSSAKILDDSRLHSKEMDHSLPKLDSNLTNNNDDIEVAVSHGSGVTEISSLDCIGSQDTTLLTEVNSGKCHGMEIAAEEPSGIELEEKTTHLSMNGLLKLETPNS